MNTPHDNAWIFTLSLDHFCVARDEEILHVSKGGNESVSIPVYFYNHGTPKMIGSIDKDSIRVFDNFTDEEKLEVLCGLLKHAKEAEI